MATTRMTLVMRDSLESRLADLDKRIETLDDQRAGDDSLEATALVVQLTRERSHIAEALRDATLIDDEPFDYDAIEIGDIVTIRDDDGQTDNYVLVDDGVGTRARADWVSVGSPLGAALVGRGKGDLVEVSSPEGVTPYVVVGFRRASGRPVFATDDSLPSEAFLG